MELFSRPGCLHGLTLTSILERELLSNIISSNKRGPPFHANNNNNNREKWDASDLNPNLKKKESSKQYNKIYRPLK